MRPKIGCPLTYRCVHREQLPLGCHWVYGESQNRSMTTRYLPSEELRNSEKFATFATLEPVYSPLCGLRAAVLSKSEAWLEPCIRRRTPNFLLLDSKELGEVDARGRSVCVFASVHGDRARHEDPKVVGSSKYQSVGVEGFLDGLSHRRICSPADPRDTEDGLSG